MIGFENPKSWIVNQNLLSHSPQSPHEGIYENYGKNDLNPLWMAHPIFWYYIPTLI